MHRISRAPLLSATLRMLSSWITSRSLLRLLEDLVEAPALVPRERPGLGDAHPVAHRAGVPLVVHLEAHPVAYHLLVEGVRLELLGDHHDGLVHAVAHHQPLAELAPAAGLCGSRVRCCHGAHASTSASPSPRAAARRVSICTVIAWA